MGFKVRARVSYSVTYKGGSIRQGTAKIVEVDTSGSRGVWYVIKDEATGEKRKVRAGCLTAI